MAVVGCAGQIMKYHSILTVFVLPEQCWLLATGCLVRVEVRILLLHLGLYLFIGDKNYVCRSTRH